MMPDTITKRLRALTGQRFRYRGQEWLLIEVLAAEDALVLASAGDSVASVQTNQYGQPSRRAARTLTLPLSPDDGGSGYSDAVLELLAGRITD